MRMVSNRFCQHLPRIICCIALCSVAVMSASCDISENRDSGSVSNLEGCDSALAFVKDTRGALFTEVGKLTPTSDIADSKLIYEQLIRDFEDASNRVVACQASFAVTGRSPDCESCLDDLYEDLQIMYASLKSSLIGERPFLAQDIAIIQKRIEQ